MTFQALPPPLPARLDRKISDYRLRAEAAERAERDTARELKRALAEVRELQAEVEVLLRRCTVLELELAGARSTK